MKKNNILLFILDLLDVKYTKIYARKYYEEHPHKNDLLGVSNMLYHYGIKSEGNWKERLTPYKNWKFLLLLIWMELL